MERRDGEKRWRGEKERRDRKEIHCEETGMRDEEERRKGERERRDEGEREREIKRKVLERRKTGGGGGQGKENRIQQLYGGYLIFETLFI